MTALDSLHDAVKVAMKGFGLTELTKPQEMAIPAIFAGENVLLIAPTGTGKTEAALLPVFSSYLKQEWRQGVKILYIAPLRALNRDMLARLTRWGNFLGVRIEVRHGDTSTTDRRKQLEHPPDMLITTPETLQAILPGRRIREHLRTVRWAIVDEIHELAEDERGAQLSVGLERLVELAGEFQRIGLSATIGSPDTVAQFLVGTKRQVKIIDASVAKHMKVRVESPMPTKEDAELADKLFAEPTMAARLRRLRELMDKHTSVLTFVNTREAAETLGSRMHMWDASYPVAVHHGSLAKEVRIEAEKKFRDAKLKGLICTSSMELGIDIGAVDLVAQYMSPRQVTRLVQRVGRSGHKIGELSQGIVLAANPDDVVEAAVIARRALTGKLEQTKVQEKSLDVLAHQLAGLFLDANNTSLDVAHALITRAYPYRNLSKDELTGVLKQLKARGLVWVKDERFERRKPGWEYYFTNLSMIPDTKRYRIYDIASRRSIGTLDEEFVAGSAEPEMSFICKGEAWKIVSIEEDRVLVEPAGDPLGAIPAWEGELIPVPFDVAQDVGKIRGDAWKRLKAGGSVEQVAGELYEKYPMEKEAAAWFVRQMEEQSKESQHLPTDNQLVIEAYEQFAVLHACFGSLVNETLARVLAALLSSKFGASVGVKIDPYRIAFKFPIIAKPELVEQSLRELKPEHVEGILQLTLGDSSMFRWRLIHVAKRFGAIKRDADLSRISPRRIARAFEGTPIQAETMREILLEKLDVAKAKEIVGLIQDGTIKLATITRMHDEGPTPLSWPVLNELASAGELVVPKRAEREILLALKDRLNRKEVRLFCMNCYKWSTMTRVERLPEFPTCGNCDARLLTTLPYDSREMLAAIKKYAAGKRLKESERKLVTHAEKAAALILASGKRALIVLAARGVGPKTASRILAYQFKDENDFYRAILQAERLYARTRQFWGD